MEQNADRPLGQLLAVGVIALMLGAFSATSLAGGDNGVPADKVSVAGSDLEIMTAAAQNGSVSEEHTLLTAVLRSSNPTDLIFEVSLECALWTDVTTVGNDDQQAVASVEVWVEIDGEPVTVDGSENGTARAVFCDRAYRVTTLQFDDEDATIERYLRTRSANAFAWTSLDVGSGLHDIAVKAQLDGEASENAEAKAAIGARTLIVTPTKLAHDAQI